jgi:hypothetical protein
MTLDYSCPGKVTIWMDDYVKDILDEAPDEMDGTAATPAAEHLFTASVNIIASYIDIFRTYVNIYIAYFSYIL